MRQFFTLYLKELKGLFLQPMMYFIGLAISAVNAFILFFLRGFFIQTGEVSPQPLMSYLLGDSFLFWTLLLILCPLLSMCAMSEEVKNGTMETLLTLPLSHTIIVLAKFFAILKAFSIAWFPTFLLLLFLFIYSGFGLWPIVSAYLGFCGVVSAFLAIGLFFSTLFKSSLLSAVVTFFVLFTMVLFVPLSLQHFGLAKHFSLIEHLGHFIDGRIVLRSCVVFVSLTVVSLFLSIRFLDIQREGDLS